MDNIKTIDNHYFANINYYKILFNNKNVTFCSQTAYQKGWLGNKCSIVGANGIINLSTPLLGGRNQKSLYKDVKIAYDQNWRLQHLRAIKSCYGNAPYFIYYFPMVEKILNQKFERLFDLNLFIVESVLKTLKINIPIIFEETSTPPESILFTKKNIQLNPDLNISTINYPQVFEERLGFVPNLSIIDLLMCMGPQSKDLLLQ